VVVMVALSLLAVVGAVVLVRKHRQLMRRKGPYIGSDVMALPAVLDLHV